MAMQGVSHDVGQPKVAIFNDPKIRGWVYQVVLLAILIYLVVVGIQNMFANLAAQNIASGFGFLGRNAGFAISQALVPYRDRSFLFGDGAFDLLGGVLFSHKSFPGQSS